MPFAKIFKNMQLQMSRIGTQFNKTEQNLG